MGKGGYNGGSTVIHAGSGWFGKGSVTSQPEGKKKPKAALTKPKRKKKSGKKTTSVPKKGNGLTLPEILARARQKVQAIEAEIAKTKKHLAKLERERTKAQADAEKATKLPPKTAMGIAFQNAQQSSAAVKAEAGKEKTDEANDTPESGRRVTFRKTSKGVVIEHRSARKIPASMLAKKS